MIRIRCEDTGKKFKADWIFRHLNYELKQGVSYAITGPNGSGKSTLMQVLCGLLPPNRGKIKYFGNEREIDPDNIFRYLTYAAPYLELIEEFTLLEMIRFHFSLKPLLPGLKLENLPEMMYLQNSRHKFIRNFSSGMKQRIKLGLAFFSDVPVLFLDEPTTNLDQQGITWYLENVKINLPNRLTIIASNSSEEYEFCQEFLNLNDFKK